MRKVLPGVRRRDRARWARLPLMTTRRRRTFPWLALLLGFASGPLRADDAGRAPARKLRVAANHHTLERDDGAPFFYLGDTAWALFQRTTREEADHYLVDRAGKGFTVIQAAVMFDLQPDNRNAYGDLPLMDDNPERPNEAYFRHADHIVRRAAELGLYVGVLPTWGSYWKTDTGKALFNERNARTYGRFLGSRFREQPIIWILGGDQNPANQAERRILEAMAAGLREGDHGNHLITFHPRGPGASSEFFANAPWLDFHMVQSSHGSRDHDNGLFIERDYHLNPAKPTVDGEPRYETIPVGFYFSTSDASDRFDDYDVRQAAYWSVLAGACGYTYGNNNVWQFWTPARPRQISAAIPWTEALDHPGAFQMKYLRRLFEARPLHKLVPRPSMVLDGPISGGAKVRGAIASDGSFAVIYSPRGEKFTVDRSLIKGERLSEQWYDPRYGVAYPLHTGTAKSIQTYTPPTSGRGNDWILILEDAAARLPALGPPSPAVR